MTELFPRPPRRKKQPSAELLREQLRLAADEIMQLRSAPPQIIQCEHDTRAPWWRRLFTKGSK